MIINRELAKSTGCEQKDKWETPYKIFKQLDDIYNFTLDPCCDLGTAKCNTFFTEKEDGLKISWLGYVVFVNPPYSRGNIDTWMRKCYNESQNGVKIVALIPVSTSSNWWHKFVWNKSELYFYKGRIRFVGAPYTAPFSSCLAIYNLPMPIIGSYGK